MCVCVYVCTKRQGRLEIIESAESDTLPIPIVSNITTSI